MNSPIRVLHMIAILEMGGSQSMVMNLYRAIDRKKVQFDFIVDHPDRDVEIRKEIEALGGKIYMMPTFKGKNILEIKRTWIGHVGRMTIPRNHQFEKRAA